MIILFGLGCGYLGCGLLLGVCYYGCLVFSLLCLCFSGVCGVCMITFLLRLDDMVLRAFVRVLTRC